METITIQDAIARVQESGRKAASHDRVTEIISAICASGYHVRQGDVVLTYADSFDTSDATRLAERQLAPGTTQGSRHVAEGDVEVYGLRYAGPLDGPVLKVGEGGCTITHPEHRHYRLPAGSCWRVTYERDLEAEGIARVAD